ncbi:MAG: ROK family protein, partial [Chitinophagaceae bacterium]
MSVIALDLGGTKLAAAVFEETGNVSYKRTYSLSGRGGKEVGELIKEVIKTLQNEIVHERITVNGIGICVPGISDTKTGTVWAPNIPGWEDYPLKNEIEGTLKNRNLKVVVDNDRACSVLGEKWRGAAKHCNQIIFLAVGTGIGAGIIVDGKVLRGANDIAGATGWMALNRPYLERYKSCGFFEYYASG